MAKFYGEVGFAATEEVRPGVYVEKMVRHKYYGELLRNSRQLQSSGQLNDNVNLSNEISIVADPFARENYMAMRYVEYMGAKWKVSAVEVKHPRLILTIGGLFNVSETTATPRNL